MNPSKDPRFAQANREALFSLAAYALYFVWWCVCAFGLGDGDPENYTYVFGLPAWFFYSCVAGFPLISVVVWIMVRCLFRDMPLDAAEDAAHPEQPAPQRFEEKR